jgi:hypothetical protein
MFKWNEIYYKLFYNCGTLKVYREKEVKGVKENHGMEKTQRRIEQIP